MVFCSKCGKELPENAFFCPACGFKTAKGIEAKVSMPYGDIASDIGIKLEQAFLTASEEMKKAFERAREEIKRVTSKERLVCPKCGQKNSIRDRFCSKCGEKLS
jgi:uncharacterized membrane protein YvbJ